MGRERGVIKKSEVNRETTYILCPNPECQLFFKPNCTIPCEFQCPYESEMRKIVKCGGCDEIIVLDGDSSPMKRVDHDCRDGVTASTFARGSAKYQLIYKMPED